MTNLEKLTIDSFDLLHNYVCQHLMETKGECDHDEHGEILENIINKLKEYT
jgi:hypothetical protein